MPPGLMAALVAALAAVGLCACAAKPSTPFAQPGPTIPAQWANANVTSLTTEPTVSLAQWWQHFSDPVLTALIAEALHANTDLRSARAALQQARAVRDGKFAGLGPSVNGSASAQKSRAGANDANDTFQVGFDASWEPDVFGGKQSAANAAEYDVQAAQSNIAQVRVSMAAEVAITYIDLRALQARLAIARDNLALQQETLQIARWRYQAGLASALDVEQAISASEQTGAQIPALTTSLALDFSSLAVLTGRAQATLQTELRSPDALAAAAGIPQAPAILAVSIPPQTLRQRPDVGAAEHRIRASLERVAQADAARYPSFQISGSLGLRALTLGALTDGASVARSVMAGLSVPLFDGGAARAQIRTQEAVLEQARVNYEATVRLALKDVEDALVALQSDTERLSRLSVASGAAAKADVMARQRYSSGLIDFRAVLETQRTLLSTQDGVASTRAALSADHVRLYKALGGGWIPESETISP